ncbi:hypothetical protein KLMA_20633 [Kluyveromyces marxianus DMKU3-1042]|uniref:Uncharacterized protein n=1 Tax=Kluyveromyces marxianus (strain DMKU3-1042 / BCC 29191 / NBRC 104275) TaxID=1003335 RepID=W0T8E1_KLUMD|nr:hypothetical protein KLMA_20633 [Kluyveromyces marxianus DMKU3-1042]BAO39091.1 hypothetical protein KLMA_20633 [Kluyveromyces marxianus DMKU3-1042]
MLYCRSGLLRVPDVRSEVSRDKKREVQFHFLLTPEEGIVLFSILEKNGWNEYDLLA